MKVDTRGMIPLGTDKHKGDIDFNTTFDREVQLQYLHKGNRSQAELTPEELDFQALHTDEQKKKEALEKTSILPVVPVRRKSKRKKKKKIKKLAIGLKFRHDDGNIYKIIKIYSKKVAARSGKVGHEFNIPYVQKQLI